jgi:hypothetical protein
MSAKTFWKSRTFWGLCCAAILFCLTWFVLEHTLPAAITAKMKHVEGLVIGFGHGHGGSSITHPVALRVVYRDTECYPGEGGGAAHEGTATYVFKNTLPVPVKFAFPPIGYVSGGLVPFAPQCSDVEHMPEFCRTAQIVELEPFGERHFESRYLILTAARNPRPPSTQFIFGMPAGSPEKRLIVDAVQSAGDELIAKP